MKTKHVLTAIGACAVALALAACTTSALNVTPPVTFVPANGKLVMTVGTVNFNGGAGINVLATYRSPKGYTAVPVNAAMLTGPAGFAGPAGSADPGAGLAIVPFGAANNNFTLTNGASTNLAGVDGFGVGPPLSSLPAGNPANAFPLQPQFSDTANAGAFGPQVSVYGFPPAYPAQQPGAPPGYPEGFYLLATGLPPTGTYTVNDTSTQNGHAVNASATSTLTSNALLPVMPTPSYVSNGSGGGTVSETVPGGIVQTIVNINDTTTGGGASVIFSGTGLQTANIASGTFTTGDALSVQAFGFDYDEFSLGPPNNLSQVPALPAQADVSVSGPSNVPALRIHHAGKRMTHLAH